LIDISLEAAGRVKQASFKDYIEKYFTQTTEINLEATQLLRGVHNKMKDFSEKNMQGHLIESPWKKFNKLWNPFRNLLDDLSALNAAISRLAREIRKLPGLQPIETKLYSLETLWKLTKHGEGDRKLPPLTKKAFLKRLNQPPFKSGIRRHSGSRPTLCHLSAAKLAFPEYWSKPPFNPPPSLPSLLDLTSLQALRA